MQLFPLCDSSAAQFGDHARRLTQKLFDPISHEDAFTALRNLNKDDISKMTPSLLQQLITKYPFLCDRIDSLAYSKLSFSRECFNHVPSDQKGCVLRYGKSLDGDLLKNVAKGEITAWSCLDGSKTGSKIEGWRLLSTEKTKHLVAHLGEDPYGDSPCLDLPSTEELASKEYNVLVAQLSVSCFNALPREWSEELEKGSPRLMFILPWNQIAGRPGLFEKLTGPQLGYLMGGGDFCSKATAEQLNKIPIKVFAQITGNCLSKSNALAGLDDAHVRALGSEAYNSMEANKITDAMIAIMTTTQLSTACQQVTDTTQNNLGRRLNEGVLRQFSSEKIGAITGTQWQAVDPPAFSAITAENMGAIKPSNTTRWTLAQVQNLSKDAVSALTKDHTSAMATDNDAERVKVADYLRNHPDVKEDCKSPVPTVVSPTTTTEPVSTEGSRSSASSTTWPIIIGVIVTIFIVIAGGLGYYFFFMH